MAERLQADARAAASVEEAPNDLRQLDERPVPQGVPLAYIQRVFTVIPEADGSWSLPITGQYRCRDTSTGELARRRRKCLRCSPRRRCTNRQRRDTCTRAGSYLHTGTAPENRFRRSDRTARRPDRCTRLGPRLASRSRKSRTPRPYGNPRVRRHLDRSSMEMRDNRIPRCSRNPHRWSRRRRSSTCRTPDQHSPGSGRSSPRCNPNPACR
jgi:hypothetical protein